MIKRGIDLIPHVPYSPDLAPADFWLFPQVKRMLGGQLFTRQQEMETAVEGSFREMWKNGPVNVMDRWLKRLKKCIEVEGDYIEKYKSFGSVCS